MKKSRENKKYIIKTREDIRRQKIIVYSVLFLLLTILIFVCYKSFSVSVASTEEIEESKEKIVEPLSMEENENKINIEEILEENTKSPEKKSLVTEEVDLEYTTEYKDNENLSKGTIQVVQEGRDGSQEIVIIKTYKGDEFVEEERITNKITRASVNKIVEIGTGEGSNNYTPKVGDSVYVTSETLAIRKDANNKAEKLCTINKEEKVTIVEIVNDWYKVKYSTYVGYAPANCFTNINPNVINIEDLQEGTEYTKEQLLSTLDFNMDLNKPSGLTLDQFKKVLSGNSSDTQKVIENNAEYFYYIERQYNINGIYVAAMAIHEGGWGTSTIANDKKNLFGYGAYDSNPYGGAYSFGTYAEGIDLVARMLVKYYLNPAGTIIYEGQVATGAYYNGSNLTGVNTRYASDKNWANAVYKWMEYLYNRL